MRTMLSLSGTESQGKAAAPGILGNQSLCDLRLYAQYSTQLFNAVDDSIHLLHDHKVHSSTAEAVPPAEHSHDLVHATTGNARVTDIAQPSVAIAPCWAS